MLSKKDQAIKEHILNPQTVETFFKYVYIRKSDDAIVADSLEEFMTKITDPCHIWQGSSNYGYGYFGTYNTKSQEVVTIKAHRFAYAYYNGFDALPKGINGGNGQQMILNHICHNRLCVNPKHLEIITHADNLSHEKRKPKYV